MYEVTVKARIEAPDHITAADRVRGPVSRAGAAVIESATTVTSVRPAHGAGVSASGQQPASPEAGWFAADITRRARWAREANDGRPEPAWSTGERLAVALALGDQATLEAEGYTRHEAAQRLAGDLAYYGYPGDVGAWLDEIRAALRGSTARRAER